MQSLAIVPQGLVAASAEAKQLALYSTRESKFKQQQLIDLPDTDEPEIVKAVVVADGVAGKKSLELIVGDEKTGNHYLSLPWNIARQEKSTYTIVSVTSDVQADVMARFGGRTFF